MSAKKVIVIGAGFGGLSAAAYLARAGHDVTILEKNKTIGGRAMTLKKKGFTFDMGPNWYNMPDVFDEFFGDFDTTAEQFYELTQLKPSYKVFTHETDYNVETWPEVAETFDSLDPGSSKRLEKFLRQSEKEYRTAREGILTQTGLHKGDAWKLMLSRNARRSIQDRIAKVTKNQDLQHILEFMTVTLGGSPKMIPALYAPLSYIDLGIGAWYPKGGFGAVVKAFQTIAKKAGVTIQTNAAVERILTDHHHVSGVVVNGEAIACDLVVAAADYHHVESQLLEKHDQSYHEKFWQKRTMSPSAMLAYIGVKKQLPGLHHHNLLFDVSWDRHIAQMFDTKEWSTKPSVYVGNPTKSDPSFAPKGMETLVVMAPMANGLDPTDEQLERTTLSIIGRLQEELGYEFINDIVVADVKAQDYFAQSFNAYQGSAFGLSHTLAQSGHRRPKMKSGKVHGLYFAGQDTNPGTGVPMVILSGKIVADLIQKTEH